MKKKDFYYYLPKDLIAQKPILKRDTSKLLVLNKKTGEIKHLKFHDLINFLEPKDCLVLNNSKVILARIFGTNEKTGAKLEFLLLEEKEKNVWKVLAKPAKRARIGEFFKLSNGLRGQVVEVFEDFTRTLKFYCDEDFNVILNKIGNVPLPPYIKEKLEDVNRYQTVYGKVLGSAAAPTAGLHFTKEMLKEIKNKGISVAFVTLHVGLGTFLPVKEEEIEKHKMHSEKYFLKEEDAEKINETKKKGGRVFCVGTTSCRVVESVYLKKGRICEDFAETEIFIYPGFRFNVMDALITNFHLPESTLLMLVSAFATREKTMNAYKKAIENRYRFFSFGDAMLII